MEEYVNNLLMARKEQPWEGTLEDTDSANETLADLVPGTTHQNPSHLVREITHYTQDQIQEFLRGKKLTMQRTARALLRFFGEPYNNPPSTILEPHTVQDIIAEATQGISEEASQQGDRIFPALTHPQVKILEATLAQRIGDDGAFHAVVIYRLRADNPEAPRDDPSNYYTAMRRLKLLAKSGSLPLLPRGA